MYRLIAIYLAFVCTVPLYAQWHLGLKGGYTLSELKNIPSEKYSGYHFGVLSVYDFNDFFALQSVLLYAEKGYKVKEGVLDEGKIKSVKARFHFVSLPVLLEYKPFPFMALELGPSFGFQVGRELFFDKVLQPDTRFGIKRIFNVDGIVGCKFIYRQIYIEGQYYKSFSSLYRKVDDFKLRGFSVSLGYNFKLK